MEKHRVLPNSGVTVSRSAFLKDVFICSLGAYGGPEGHMSVFIPDGSKAQIPTR